MTQQGFDSAEALEIFGDLLPKIGREVLRIRAEGRLHVAMKKTAMKELVTAGDLHVKEVLFECLRKNWPYCRIRSEEGIEVFSGSGYEFLVDEIDATNRFALGMDMFSISVGLTFEGAPIFGVFYFPANGIFVNASRGRGTFVSRERVILPQNAKGLEDEVFVSCDLGRDPRQLERIRSFKCHIMEIHSYTGTVLHILQGNICAYVHGGATPFDLGASALVAIEAGCVVTQLDGNPIDFSQKKIPVVIARNRRIYEQLMEICGS